MHLFRRGEFHNKGQQENFSGKNSSVSLTQDQLSKLESDFLNPNSEDFSLSRAKLLHAIKIGDLKDVFNFLKTGKHSYYRTILWKFFRDEFGRRIAETHPDFYADPTLVESQNLRRLRLVSLLLNPNQGNLQSSIISHFLKKGVQIKKIDLPTSDGKMLFEFPDKQKLKDFIANLKNEYKKIEKKFDKSKIKIVDNSISFTVDDFPAVMLGLEHFEPIEYESEAVKELKNHLSKKVLEKEIKEEAKEEIKKKKSEPLASHWFDVHDGKPWFALKANEKNLFGDDFPESQKEITEKKEVTYRELTFKECQQVVRKITVEKIERDKDQEIDGKEEETDPSKQESILVENLKIVVEEETNLEENLDDVPGSNMTDDIKKIVTDAAEIPITPTKQKINIDVLLENSSFPLVKVGETLDEAQKKINQEALVKLFNEKMYNGQEKFEGQNFQFNRLLFKEFPILECLRDFLGRENYIFPSSDEVQEIISAYLTEQGLVLNLAKLDNTKSQRIVYTIFTRILEIHVLNDAYDQAKEIESFTGDLQQQAENLKNEKILDKQNSIENVLTSFDLEELLVPVPPDGDCFYHSVMLNILYGVLTEEITDETATGQVIRRRVLSELESEFKTKFGKKIDLKGQTTLKQAFLTLLNAEELALSVEQKVQYKFSKDESESETEQALRKVNLAKLLHGVGMPALRYLVSYYSGFVDQVKQAVKEELKLEFRHRFLIRNSERFGISLEVSNAYLSESALMSSGSLSESELTLIFEKFELSFKEILKKEKHSTPFDEGILDQKFEELWEENFVDFSAKMKSFHTHSKIMASTPQHIALSQGLRFNLRKSAESWQGQWQNFWGVSDIPEKSGEKVSTLYLRQGSGHYDAYLGELGQERKPEAKILQAHMKIVSQNYVDLAGIKLRDQHEAKFEIGEDDNDSEKNVEQEDFTDSNLDKRSDLDSEKSEDETDKETYTETTDTDKEEVSLSSDWEILIEFFSEKVDEFIDLKDKIYSEIDGKSIFPNLMGQAIEWSTKRLSFVEEKNVNYQLLDQLAEELSVLEENIKSLENLFSIHKEIKEQKKGFLTIEQEFVNLGKEFSLEKQIVKVNEIGFKEYFPSTDEVTHEIVDAASISLHQHAGDSKLLTEETQKAFLSEAGLAQRSDSGQTFQIKGLEENGEFHMQVLFAAENKENDEAHEIARMITMINMLSQVAAVEDIVILAEGEDFAMLAMGEIYGLWLAGKHPSISNDEPIIDGIELPVLVNFTEEQQRLYKQAKEKAQTLFERIISERKDILTQADFYRDGRKKWAKSLARTVGKKEPMLFSKAYREYGFLTEKNLPVQPPVVEPKKTPVSGTLPIPLPKEPEKTPPPEISSVQPSVEESKDTYDDNGESESWPKYLFKDE